MSYRCLIVLLCALAVAISVISLSVGSIYIQPAELLRILSGEGERIPAQIVLDIRLPRVLTGLIVGGMLALAGSMMQVLLRNPLAEPYILGISGGAAVFALLSIAIGLSGMMINISACIGAFVTMLLVFMLSRAGPGWNPLRVLLTGVVISAGWSALISLLLVLSSASQVHSMLFWLMGDVSFNQYSPWYGVLLGVIAVLAMLMARGMNLLSQGDLSAAALGVHVPALRLALYFLASVLTALAVMQAGNIGFIGLIVPHTVRMLVGSDHRRLLPAVVLSGGILLLLADTLARTCLHPLQLPVGVLMAFIGVPLFLCLLHSTAARQRI